MEVSLPKIEGFIYQLPNKTGSNSKRVKVKPRFDHHLKVLPKCQKF
jgi:hypothetical protein